MRLSRAGANSKRRRNLKVLNSRVKQKHKRLDAICEKAYNQNHTRLEAKLSECNGETSEVRRSSRVRRAPLVLDASPPPPRKRQKISEKRAGSSERAKDRFRAGFKTESPCSTSRDLNEEELGEWRSRLRNRGRKVTFVSGSSSSAPSGKRKLFGASNGIRKQANLDGRQVDNKKGVFLGETSLVVKSKRPGRIKASNVVSNGHEEIVLANKDKDGEDTEGIEDIDLGNKDKDAEDTDGNEEIDMRKNDNDEEGTDGHEDIDLVNDDKDEDGLDELQVLGDKRKGCLLDDGVKDNTASAELLEQGNEVASILKPENGDDVVQPAEQNEPVKRLEFGQREDQNVQQEAVELSSAHAEDGTRHINLLKDENSHKVDDMKFISAHRLHRPRIKEGRHCGLCGGGTDGKPPKKLVQDGAGSDNEAYSGSSSSSEPNYDIWDGFGDESGWLGRLLGPINDRFGIAGIWVHQHCAVWSPEVYFAGLGCLKNVRAALCRGRVLKCTRCGRRGATVGCRVDRCPKTYHLPCARANGCIFDHRKFLIACTDHRHLFQPHGSKCFDRLKKIKAKKMKLEIRKLSDDAWRKDHEAEEKWLENCGEDEEFLKRENKRLQRDLLRIAPVYIGGSKSENEMPFEGWESVGGLQDVIQCLKEVVILPLLYPEFFHNLGLTPPRGVLLHGYPGTGKTLVVRALIGSCARGDKRIAYFARKGADCLGKYVGDAERQLRLLFQVAEKSQPSIIFFDEIDGLAPSRTRQQDQTHNSVVSTLLALLDGLKSRGSVVVIGATNRPDAIDPALRRPGRFDREIYFPLPSLKDREAILSLHTRKWPSPVTGSLLKLIARRTVGFAGADLQALCTQTAIIALKRRCPWEKLLLAAEEKAPQGRRPLLPKFEVEERDWLEALSSVPPPCSRREAGMAANDIVSSPLPDHLFHCMLQPILKLIISLYLDERICLPVSLSKAAAMIKTVIVDALDNKRVRTDGWWSQVDNLLKEAGVASDIESKLLRAGVLVGDGTSASFDAFDDDINDHSLKYGPSMVDNGLMQTNLLRRVSNLSEKKSGFCLLISGSPRSGQGHLASCVLHCFVGNAVLQKVDLATMSQEGGGDMVLGLTQILGKCANIGSCMIFMPRIDLWALEACKQVDEEVNDSSSPVHCEVIDGEKASCSRLDRSSEKKKPQDPGLRASHLWSSFVEQAESMFISSCLMVLATSEVPLELLPLRVEHFFGRNKQDFSSTHMGGTVPRFAVHVDGKFDSGMVIDSSAAKLSNDVAQYFIQLLHHGTHIHGISSKEYESLDTVDADANIVCPNLDSDLAIKHVSKNQNSSLPYPNKKEEKGKSNLLLAISTFGYQILQYPHFAELCWVTSKLKEGPCANIHGPWKGWPFNSCIVRPSETSEKVVVASSSSNTKSTEKYGLVRGLIAVGLSAYRGVYSSLREVSGEVRKVLELLTLQINAKIAGGRERYQYTRLLSQVAYLEDMVNSWAYTLQSSESSTQLTEATQKLDISKTLKNDLVQGDDCKNISSYLELMEENTATAIDKAIDSHHLKEVDVCAGHTVCIVNDSNPIIQSQGSSSFKDQLDLHSVIEPKGVSLESSNVRDSGNHLEFRSLEHSNGFAKETVLFPEDGPCSAGDLNGMKVSDAGRGCNQGQSLSSADTNVLSEDKNQASNGKNMHLSADQVPGGICFYRLCYKCLFDLHTVMQRILVSQWDMKASNLMAEDVHDAVTSLSLNLRSVVRKFCLSGSLDISFDKNLKLEKYRTLFKGREVWTCHCEASGNREPMAMECCCHSQSSSTADVDSSSRIPRHGLDSEFIYKNGVLAVLDPEKDLSFHCKFQTLCLCSLIEYIVMTKQPS